MYQSCLPGYIIVAIQNGIKSVGSVNKVVTILRLCTSVAVAGKVEICHHVLQVSNVTACFPIDASQSFANKIQGENFADD